MEFIRTRFSRSRFRLPHSAGLLLLLLAAANLSCSTSPVRMYPGDPRPKSEVAIFESGKTRILRIDDLEVDGRRFELLPGTRAISARVTIRGEEMTPAARDLRDSMICRFLFHAEAGHTYKIIRTRLGRASSSDTVTEVRTMYPFDLYVMDTLENRRLNSVFTRCRSD